MCNNGKDLILLSEDKSSKTVIDDCAQQLDINVCDINNNTLLDDALGKSSVFAFLFNPVLLEGNVVECHVTNSKNGLLIAHIHASIILLTVRTGSVIYT